MADELSDVMERRRLRRRVTIWRALAFVVAIAAVSYIAFRGSVVADFAGQPYIARVKIDGVITEDRKQLELLEDLKSSDAVRAVILDVNSPGGTTTGGEALFNSIREIAAEKPVVAVFGTIATSAAYIVGLSADHIVARGNTITGSVGVIFQWAQVDGLLNELGVQVNSIKSGTLKAVPSPFEPASPAALDVTRELVDDSQEWFLGLVTSRRELELASVPGLTEGRIYSGRQAAEYKLVDAIGGEDAALTYLRDQRDISADLKIRERKPKRDPELPFLSATGLALLKASGLGDSALAAMLLRSGDDLELMRLNGLLSIYRPGQ